MKVKIKKTRIRGKNKPRTYEKERCAKIFTQNLLALREAHNLTHKQLGEIVGRDRSTISRWESHSDTFRFPEPESIDKLCDYFKIAVYQFFLKGGGSVEAFGLAGTMRNAIAAVEKGIEEGRYAFKIVKAKRKGIVPKA